MELIEYLELPSAQILTPLFSQSSVVHSQDVLFVPHFLGLTEKEIQNCVSTETKKSVLFFSKKEVEHRCTTNKMSKKYEGKSILLAT